MRQQDESVTISLTLFCIVAVGYFVVIAALNMGLI